MVSNYQIYCKSQFKSDLTGTELKLSLAKVCIHLPSNLYVHRDLKFCRRLLQCIYGTHARNQIDSLEDNLERPWSSTPCNEHKGCPKKRVFHSVCSTVEHTIFIPYLFENGDPYICS